MWLTRIILELKRDLGKFKLLKNVFYGWSLLNLLNSSYQRSGLPWWLIG